MKRSAVVHLWGCVLRRYYEPTAYLLDEQMRDLCNKVIQEKLKMILGMRDDAAAK